MIPRRCDRNDRRLAEQTAGPMRAETFNLPRAVEKRKLGNSSVRLLEKVTVAAMTCNQLAEEAMKAK